jgi:hypothetical protein
VLGLCRVVLIAAGSDSTLPGVVPLPVRHANLALSAMCAAIGSCVIWQRATLSDSVKSWLKFNYSTARL